MTTARPLKKIPLAPLEVGACSPFQKHPGPGVGLVKCNKEKPEVWWRFVLRSFQGSPRQEMTNSGKGLCWRLGGVSERLETPKPVLIGCKKHKHPESDGG